jgi:hypothetical protein
MFNDWVTCYKYKHDGRLMELKGGLMTRDLSREERQSLLVKASRDYVDGKITAEDLEEAERQYMPDYMAAATAIAKARIGTMTPNRVLESVRAS